MNKKSIKLLAENFSENVDEILEFTQRVKKVTIPKNQAEMTAFLKEEDEDRCFDIAIISLYQEFENLIFECLVALINNDSSTFSKHKGLEFPRHMKVEICEYLICGDGYFDFKGRGGLIKKIREFVPDNHCLVRIVKSENYKSELNKLVALRNFAAHKSSVSKKQALKYTEQTRMSSTSGAWLKIQESGCPENRFTKICKSLQRMASEIMASEIAERAALLETP